MKMLILGAGPCGLGAAYHLKKLGYSEWQIFERNGYVGGLSASFCDENGFTWDVGGHVLFSHYDYFDKVVADALGDSVLRTPAGKLGPHPAKMGAVPFSEQRSPPPG